MNKEQRAKMVRAMELLVRSVNDEEQLDIWLRLGVGDGDIDEQTTDQDLEEMGYLEDQTYKELMSVFIKTMYLAWNEGGLYDDGITSADKSDYKELWKG